MTWSSSSPFGTAADVPTGTSDWQWDELETPRATPSEERARNEELHAQEIEAAYHRGRVEGEDAARAAARRELASALSVARTVVRETQEARAGWNARLEENLILLATAMARQVVDRELRSDAESFRALAARAVASFPVDEPLRIRLHPEDLELLASLDPSADPAAILATEHELRWVPDDDVVQGGCVVEGPDRIVDGRVDEALRRIYSALIHG